MALEPGGYADKLGNRYEGRWVVKQMLRVLNEELTSITLEPVGDDEKGVDLWLEDRSGKRFAHQCKLRNGSKDKWTIADLKRSGVLEYLADQLNRDPDVAFCLVSPITSTLFHDICNSARHSSGDSESFYQQQIVGISKERTQAFNEFCAYLSLNPEDINDRTVAYNYLPRIFIENWPDTLSSQEDMRAFAQWLVNGDSDSVIANLGDYAESHIRKRMTASGIWHYLKERGFSSRALAHDDRLLPSIQVLKDIFHDSIASELIADELITREESQQTLEALDNEGIAILHGRPGQGKSSVLYEITQTFERRGQIYLPVRLDRQTPQNTPQKFGVDIGLPESPVKCLSALLNEQPCTLILDQLDAIRWTNAHSKNALEICKSLVREVMRLRNEGKSIQVILSCRTYDLENDPDIKSWVEQIGKNTQSKQVAKIDVGPLSDNVVKEVAKKFVVSPLSDHQISILKSAQHLAMWVQLTTDGRKEEFSNRVQLMRRFWEIKTQELVAQGISVEQVNAEISRVIRYMESKSRISAPLSISTNTPVLDGLCACGLIQIASNQITFSHQNYLDFQIANNLAQEIYTGDRDISAWLGAKENQSLFHREQLRQVLSLLGEESPRDFLEEVKKLLNNPEVRFNLKHLTLEVVGQLEAPSTMLQRYILSLFEQIYWQEHVFSTVYWGHIAYLDWLVVEKQIETWLGNKSQKRHALLLLRSIAEKHPDLVADVLSPYLEDSHWHQDILECLSGNVAKDSEKLFQVRFYLAKHGVVHSFVDWKKIPSERAIRLLEAVLLSHKPDDFAYDNRWELRNDQSRLKSWTSSDLGSISVAAKSQPDKVWNRIFPQILRLSSNKNPRDLDVWLTSNMRKDYGRECLPYGTTQLCLQAGNELAKNNSHYFWQVTEQARQNDSVIIKFILVTVYAKLDASLTDNVLTWFLSHVPEFSVGVGDNEPKWMPAARLIEAMSPYCSDQIFSELEKRVTYFKEEGFLTKMRNAVSAWRKGSFLSYWGEAQYFLLPSLHESRRSSAANELITVLNRKFESFDAAYFLSRNRVSVESGIVTSTIPRYRVKDVSDQAWLTIISNKNIPDSGGFHLRVRDKKGIRESSVEQFSRDLEYVAALSPNRFARLALRFSKDTSSEYKSAIIAAFKEKQPKGLSNEEQEIWVPVDHQLALQVLEKFDGESTGSFASRFCWFIHERSEDEWPDNILNRLFEYATSHPDPELDKLKVWDVKVGNGVDKATTRYLEGTAINCVRGVAARAIASLLWSHQDLWEQVKPVLEQLIEDKHPAVRLAALEILLPVINFDPNYAVNAFICSIKGDFRIAASRSATQIFNACMKEYYSELSPLVIGMLESQWDDVVEQGVQEVTARWLFYRHFTEELESCITGRELLRKAVAHIAAENIGEASYFEKCTLLIDRLINDQSKDVRRELESVFRVSELFSTSIGRSFLINFISVSPFFVDLDSLFYKLENHSVNLIPFASLLLAIGGQYITPRSQLGDSHYGYYVTHYYMPLMVRLYEQAKDQSESDIELRCLDIWDAMYEKRIGEIMEISKVIG